MKVINLFGPPGVGKSTVAAGVFWALKRRGIEVELVTEFAKALVWDGRSETLQDQIYIFAKQNSALTRLTRHKDLTFAVTDSPLLFSMVYRPEAYYAAFDDVVRDVFHSYDNINFYLNAEHSYSKVGRNHDEHDAKALDVKIRTMLTRENVLVTPVVSSESAVDFIVAYLVNQGLIPPRGSTSAGT